MVAPEITVDRLLDLRLYREVGAFVRDANPVRSVLIRVGAGLDYWVFSESPQPLLVLVGDNGWLYRREEIDRMCDATSPETAVDNMIDLVHEIEGRGTQVVFTIAPSKFEIHPEYLTPDQIALHHCAQNTSRRIQTALRAAGHEGYVDAWEVFRTVRARGIDTYFRTDTHFNYSASIAWIESVISAIDADIWEPEAIVYQGMGTHLGNLMTMIGLDAAEVVPIVIVDRGLPRFPVEQFHRRFSHTQTSTERYEASSTKALITGRVLALKDSFWDLPAPSLAQYFADLTVTDWRSEESIDYFARQAHQADVVIIQTSADGLVSRFGDSRLLSAFKVADPSPGTG